MLVNVEVLTVNLPSLRSVKISVTTLSTSASATMAEYEPAMSKSHWKNSLHRAWAVQVTHPVMEAWSNMEQRFDGAVPRSCAVLACTT